MAIFVKNTGLIVSFTLYTIFLFNNSLCQMSQCPSASELAPYCDCSVGSSGDFVAILDCSAVENEDQLELLFATTSFPVLSIHEFKISDNQELKFLSRNVFGNVSFEIILFQNVAIEYIAETAFENSHSSLLQWTVYDCNMLPEGFPFQTLNFYTSLTLLNFNSAGKFDVLPRITSSSLQRFYVTKCDVRYVHSESFQNIPNLTTVDLRFNKITRLLTGTISNLDLLTVIDLQNNKISFIEPGSFEGLPELHYLYLNYNFLQHVDIQNLGVLPSLRGLFAYDNKLNHLSKDLFQGSPLLSEVYAGANNLTMIEPGTFDVLNSGALSLVDNLLTTLNEDWLRTIVNNNSSFVDVSRNPLECGCDVAWLFQDPYLLNNLNAQCANGTRIQDLDSSYFTNNC